MKLLIFAHKAEAQLFIRNAREETLPGTKITFYKQRDYYVQIVGQGFYYSSIKLSYLCCALSKEVHEIINMGISGSLNNKYKVNEIYKISSVLKRDENTLILNNEDGIKCYTSQRFLRTIEDRNKFSQIADLVDMELWGIAAVSKYLKLPIRSYKLVSDLVGENISCNDIKIKADKFSEQLFNFYNSIHY